MPVYKDLADRVINRDYISLLGRILESGFISPTLQGPEALTLMQQNMKFDLSDGFPIITERNVAGFWNRPIGELCAMFNGVTSEAGFREFGCTWWGPWMTDEMTDRFGIAHGTSGESSYGAAFTRFPTLDGGTFDQIENIVRQIKERPFDRVHLITPWMPAENARGAGFKQKNTIAPCHGWLHIRVLRDRATGELVLHLKLDQRSGDVPIGVPSNTIQYAAFVLMLEQLTGYRAGFLYHSISDAHIYEDQIPNVRELLSRPSYRYPRVTLSDAGREVTSLKGFRREHFLLDRNEYQAGPEMKDIPVST